MLTPSIVPVAVIVPIILITISHILHFSVTIISIAIIRTSRSVAFTPVVVAVATDVLAGRRVIPTTRWCD